MASVGSESPPRKKLKQARLPFQVISSPRTEGEKATGGLKRKLSESDDIQITKVVKSANVEEIKENTVHEDLKTGMKAMLSSLLTSKIINNCTETVEENDIPPQKCVTNEGVSQKLPVVFEEQTSTSEDLKKKNVLSKNVLEKLSSWKKSPLENEPVTHLEVVEKTLEQSSPSETSKTTPATVSEIPSNLQHKTFLSSSVETVSKKEVDESCSEDYSSAKAIEVVKSEDQSENSNHSANSSVVEIDSEPESNLKKEGSNDATPTPSPKAPQCSATSSPRTPKGVSDLGKSRITPKQLARMKEAARKQEEKDRIKIEKERKKQEEHEEKLRLKQEKEEQKRKEKEEKEEQKRKEKEEKEKKRQADIELKHEEKRRKDEQKAEEKRKREDEKRKAEEEEERKKAKVSAMFSSFFVAKSSKPAEKESSPASQTVQNFMPFEVKSDMRVAPCTRNHLDVSRMNFLDEILGAKKDYPTSELYVAQLRRGLVTIGRSGRTWLREDTKEEDITILEPASEGVFIEQPKLEKMRAKFLQFHENYRPAYYGTWRKKSESVSGRRPTAQDTILDYDVDSADEWEEEEPGESLNGSDDEEDKEPEDEYEVDNSLFVPHGHLSDDEGDAEIDEQTLNPEMQKAKLKILGEEFETQMKTKTSVLKPLAILLTAAMQSAKLPGSLRYQKLADRRAVWREDEGPIDVSPRIETSDSFGTSPMAHRLDADGVMHSGSRGAKPKEIVDEAIPALITLVHGAPIKGSFLVNEFYEFLKRQSEVSEATPADGATMDGKKIWPKLPPASKACIARKLKELATWDQCNEVGPMKGKRCWLVSPEKRERYGLSDLKLPNRWKFILKRPRAEKTPLAEASPQAEPSPPVEATTSSAKKCLITNFTKVMTAEEKQRDWAKMKKSPPAKKPASTKSSGKITAFTSLLPATASSAPASVSWSAPVSPAPAAPKVEPQRQKTAGQQQSPAPVKKRVALLVSVPCGQDIASAAGAARTSNAVATSGSVVSAGILKTEEPAVAARKEEPEVIELD